MNPMIAAVLLLLAVPAAPAAVAGAPDACRFLGRDLRTMAEADALRPPSVGLALADEARACEEALGLRGLASCMATAGEDALAPPIGLPDPLSGVADFKLAALVKTPCADADSPYALAGLTAGNLGNPLALHFWTYCLKAAHEPPRWIPTVLYDFEIRDVSYRGKLPALGHVAAMELDFDLQNDVLRGSMTGSATPDAEGCAVVAEMVKSEALAAGIRWGNVRLAGAAPSVHGSLRLLDSPTGPLVDLAGNGTARLSVAYAPDGSSTWGYDARWTATTAGSCSSDLCLEGVVQSNRHSGSILG